MKSTITIVCSCMHFDWHCMDNHAFSAKLLPVSVPLKSPRALRLHIPTCYVFLISALLIPVELVSPSEHDW